MNSEIPQESAESPQNTGDVISASILSRFLAVLIDGILIGVGLALLKIILGISSELLNLVVFLTYETVMIGTSGQTLGKKITKVKVVLTDGQDIKYGRAFLRAIGSRVSAILLGLGYVAAFFTDNKRALHDFIAGTRVIKSH
jgi:uncharacterized RDD family membrane protein YckC